MEEKEFLRVNWLGFHLLWALEFEWLQRFVELQFLVQRKRLFFPWNIFVVRPFFHIFLFQSIFCYSLVLPESQWIAQLIWAQFFIYPLKSLFRLSLNRSLLHIHPLRISLHTNVKKPVQFCFRINRSHQPQSFPIPFHFNLRWSVLLISFHSPNVWSEQWVVRRLCTLAFSSLYFQWTYALRKLSLWKKCFKLFKHLLLAHDDQTYQGIIFDLLFEYCWVLVEFFSSKKQALGLGMQASHFGDFMFKFCNSVLAVDPQWVNLWLIVHIDIDKSGAIGSFCYPLEMNDVHGFDEKFCKRFVGLRKVLSLEEQAESINILGQFIRKFWIQLIDRGIGIEMKLKAVAIGLSHENQHFSISCVDNNFIKVYLW